MTLQPSGRRSWALALACLGVGLAGAARADGVGLVMPGMNQTELQSVMGPPSYIQVNGMRQAWQYCPRILDTGFGYFSFDRRPYVTVWMRQGRVEHLRAYQDIVMGSCEDFLAAFRWEDVIEGGFGEEDFGLGK